ncbi:MAG: hypothetical protein ACD_34C00347G0002 [uncultured bacterium]|nr:MAG: hypothetical protein ACD_34C00347G0002 [uncultured bacterium]
MKRNNTIDLVEALRGNREKVSILLGFISVGLLALSIYIFGHQAKLPWLIYFVYITFTGLFLYSGIGIAYKNIWFVRLFVLIIALQEILALTGWIWILMLAQENPGGNYSALSTLPFTDFMIFFLIIFFTTFASLMISLIGLRKKRKS